jgi:membrane protein implicated in regulation of membrane protease activity
MKTKFKIKKESLLYFFMMYGILLTLALLFMGYDKYQAISFALIASAISAILYDIVIKRKQRKQEKRRSENSAK